MFGSSTVSSAGGAVSDLFAGFGAEAQGALKAKGLGIEAQGQRIQASSLRLKAQGDLAESSEYDLASQLAAKNADYTAKSTAIQQTQLDRQITMTIGSQRAAVAGAGLASSGSAMDLMRDSASQGALAKSVLQQQGDITEAGYQEQAQSYTTMANAGRATAAGEMDIATKQDAIAAQTDQLAKDTQSAADDAAFGDYVSAAFKATTAIATLAVP